MNTVNKPKAKPRGFTEYSCIQTLDQLAFHKPCPSCPLHCCFPTKPLLLLLLSVHHHSTAISAVLPACLPSHLLPVCSRGSLACSCCRVAAGPPISGGCGRPGCGTPAALCRLLVCHPPVASALLHRLRLLAHLLLPALLRALTDRRQACSCGALHNSHSSTLQ